MIKKTMSEYFEEKVQHLVDLLGYRAIHQPGKTAYTFLHDGEIESSRITYQGLDLRARAIATRLQQTCSPGERALLLFPSGLDFIAAFFGCLYAGVVAVPAYPPRRNRPDERIQAIAADAQATTIITTTDILSSMEARTAHTLELTNLHWLASDDIDEGLAELWMPTKVTGDTLAFLQYTSGSTGRPKGVMISHNNLMHNEQMIALAFGHSQNTIFTGWLPMFHDMGLVGNVLQPLYLGIPCFLMSPTAFLQKPIRWLEAISRHKATTSGGPNFAYELCLRKTTPEQRAELDLSSWEVAFNGAEPVRNDTLERFSRAFEACGFRSTAFYPCYGMAESSLFVTGGVKTDAPQICSFERQALEQRKVEQSSGAANNSAALVGCGKSWLDQEIVIANPDSNSRCEADEIGEIWVSSPSIARGYWDRPTETNQTFGAKLSGTGEGPFLRTGDLGFLRDGQLFVTGRIKDLIIIRGQNYYPQDIEYTVEQCSPTLHPGGGAAFTVEHGQQDQLVVVHEVKYEYRRKLDVDEVTTAIRQKISEQHELRPSAILLLKPGSIPKTSSGKIQRHACRSGFMEGTLKVIGEWRQLPEKNQEQFATTKHVREKQISTRDLSRKRQHVQAWMTAALGRHLRIDQKTIDIREPLSKYGMDSVSAISLIAELSEWIGKELPPTLAYDYPTIETLVNHLVHEHEAVISEPDSYKQQSNENDAVAVIGIGCRFPGADNPTAFWHILHNGIDTISEAPDSRWKSESGIPSAESATGSVELLGGFIDGVDQFDAHFFGISPREAKKMDPQQRLLLEVSWQALENAGIQPSRLAGTKTGVFIGISTNDYSRLQLAYSDGLDIYAGTGSALSIAANRLSYLLDLRGPSWAVDTACSSSLVAVHQACQNIRNGECNLAIAGGVNLILAPELTIAFSHAQMLAKDGRCKTFDADADGYVRGEGCGVVILKPLNDALRDGNTIFSVIRGSAINQDGRSNGLTAPNGPSQQAVIRQALKNAKVKPSTISYVEVHGTGTPLGDPIEINSLVDVVSENRKPEQPCWVGSVKTNIGHLEAAAGIAGLIKVILALRHKQIPPHLHLRSLNPHISIDGTQFLIPEKLTQWKTKSALRVAGVSSFGFGGTNAHIIVEESPENASELPAIDRPVHLLALSAKTGNALTAMMDAYDGFLQSHSHVPLGDICFSANTGRSHFDHRLAVMGASKDELQQQLRNARSGTHSTGWSQSARKTRKAHKVAFLFTGQGSQYAGMGRQLYETHPIFRKTFDYCDELLRGSLTIPLRDVLYSKPESDTLLNEIAYTQSAIFVIEYALYELWRSWGITPTAVAGHSLGEYAAACAAGIFTLEEGLRLVTERSRLMLTLPQNGTMAAVFASEYEVRSAILAHTPKVSIAAFNGPRNIVITGKRTDIRKLTSILVRQGIESKPLNVAHAFHSELMEPMLDEFEREAATINFRSPDIPLICCLTGKPLSPDHLMGADYWRRQTREPVQFEKVIRSLDSEGYSIFLEIGAKPILVTLARQYLGEEKTLCIPSLQQGKGDWQVLSKSLAQMYAQGVDVDWSGFDKDYQRTRVALPNYPFQRKSFWLTDGDNYMENASDVRPHTITQTTATTESKQRTKILSNLKSVVANVLHTSPSEIDAHAQLLEMGADSLLLMDAVRNIETEFGIKLTIRQLFEDLTTIDAIATFIHNNTSSGLESSSNGLS
ncbi:MAG: beta-ketoacyl synthase N-terminal-like domain-containing protein, partial [Candidatus Thiodiazotropha sp.]